MAYVVRYFQKGKIILGSKRRGHIAFHLARSRQPIKHIEIIIRSESAMSSDAITPAKIRRYKLQIIVSLEVVYKMQGIKRTYKYADLPFV